MSIVVIKILLTWWFHLFKTDMIWFHMFQCDGSKHAMMVWSGLRCFEGTIFSDRMGYPPKEADNLVGPKLHIYIYTVYICLYVHIYIHTYICIYIYIYVPRLPVCDRYSTLTNVSFLAVLISMSIWMIISAPLHGHKWNISSGDLTYGESEFWERVNRYISMIDHLFLWAMASHG